MSSSATSNLKLLLKEQWWCMSAFAAIDGDQLKNEIQSLEKITEDQMHALTEKDLNPQFVPNETDRKNIVQIANRLGFNIAWEEFIQNFNYEEKEIKYKKLGYIIFRVRLKASQTSKLKLEDIRPNYLQQLVYIVWNAIIKQKKGIFKLDEKKNPPYILSVCTGYQPSSLISWTPENLKKYQKELGLWSEIYSGSFEDYRDTVYINRIQNDLSNRKSEIHIINRNSGLVYMNPENYTKFFIRDNETPESTGYLHDFLLMTIAKIRTILFAMLVVNDQIDDDTKNLADEKYVTKDAKLIKKDLEKTTRLKNILQTMLAPFYKEISQSNRQHYTAVLERMVELTAIEKNFKMISEKMESNAQQLNSIFLNKQQEASERQGKLLNLVNVILGGGIIFDIIGYTIEDPVLQSTVTKIAGILFVSVLVLVAFILFKGKKKEKKEA